jgi:hypothetical protein
MLSRGSHLTWLAVLGQSRSEDEEIDRVRKELRMRCPRSPFIITDDVRSLNQTLDPAQRGRRTPDVFYPEEPAEHQLRVELVTPGSKRIAPPTTAKSGKQSAGAWGLAHLISFTKLTIKKMGGECPKTGNGD